MMRPASSWVSFARLLGLLLPLILIGSNTPVATGSEQEAKLGGPLVNDTVRANDWGSAGRVVGGDSWCQAQVPSDSWSVACRGGLRVKVLTYNLFWWNLFNLRGGQGQSSGKLIAASGWPEPYDVMGFQECDDVARVVTDAGLHLQYAMLQGPYALGMAYRLAAWELISKGSDDIAEDRGDQWYGKRAVQWARLKSRESGRILFFVNHHGPLPLSTGGKCGGEATAFNMMKIIAERSLPEDDILLVGDFNAVSDSPTVQLLSQRLHRIFSGASHGGVDHIFSSCSGADGTWNLGPGGSDHDALSSILQA
ncbi:unnamed protein product [Polarella glacialis]|uniref:Endonuclease/exonuclease/phosphatase domain-containing protein n=2 Tax=Polarella glacialis TaxID=89957 RepID=A0A813G8C3_POLGL|nr:unnamed protein product [Polarella glacialis]CAE8725416.1 unnamed protein product [Polarella glacialis]